MLLAIDCGNTNTVFAVFDGEDAKGEWRCDTDTNQTADGHGAWLTPLMAEAGVAPGDIDGAIIASVVPKALAALDDLCRGGFSCDPMHIGDAGVRLGIEVKVDSPGEVGDDRLVNAVAAHVRYPGPLILIDFGTATTFDVIDVDGSYMGGVIAPGINLSVEALHRAAAQLPPITVKRPMRVIGKGTVEAMESGIFWGYVGLIEGLVARITDESGDAKPQVIATGGLAPLFTDATGIITHADPDLTMRGLLAVWRGNRPS